MPIDPAKVYAVVTNNFMRKGGDGYVSLRDEATNAYDYGPGLEDVLADYLAPTATPCPPSAAGSPGSSRGVLINPRARPMEVWSLGLPPAC